MILAVPTFFGTVLVFAFTAFFSSFVPSALPAALSGLGITVCSVTSPYFLKSHVFNLLYHVSGIRLYQEGVFPGPFIFTSIVLTVAFFFLALFSFPAGRHSKKM